MRLTTRIHEWLADHVKGVQYPNVYRVSPEPQGAPLFKYQMPWYVRFASVIIIPGIIAILLCAASFFAFIAWVAISELLK